MYSFNFHFKAKEWGKRKLIHFYQKLSVHVFIYSKYVMQQDVRCLTYSYKRNDKFSGISH